MIKKLTYGLAAVMVAGCMANPVSQVAMQLPTTGGASTDPGTLALSCSELATRNNNISARLRELEAQQQSQARQNAVTDAVVGVGLSAVLGMGAQGGLSGIRTASTTVQGVEAVRRAERGQGSMASVSDSLALINRSAQLQRAYVEKGC